MGDPLSVTASVAGLVSLGLQCTQYLYQYYTEYRDQDRDLARTADQLGDLLQSLHTINEVICVRKWRPDERTMLRSIEKSINRCDDVIHELQEQASKFRKEPTKDWKQKVIVIGRRAAYPFKQSTLLKLSEDIDDFRENLSIALQTLQLKDNQVVQNDLEEVKGLIKNAQAQHVTKDVREWLKAPDASVDYNNACNKRHARTGQWFIQSSSFTNWLQQDNSFLWLFGFAGCGKSVLHSTAVQNTFRHRKANERDAIAFFSFSFSDEAKQDASAALRALLLQLAGQITNFSAELQRLEQNLNHGLPPVSTLTEYLRDAIARCRNTYILLDALDECTEENGRTGILSMIGTIRHWRLPGLHLLVTSRDTPDIRADLEMHQKLANTEWVHMRNKGIDQDIREYIVYQVDHERDLLRWSADQRQLIKDHLSDKAGGVFRWVECQLYPLKKCARSVKHLERCLRSLPETLDKSYERMLCNISDESRSEAQRLLSLLCYSAQPLTVDEVLEALAVDIDELNCYDESSRLSSAEDLMRICPGLIEISSPFPIGYDDEDSKDNEDSDDEDDEDEDDGDGDDENGDDDDDDDDDNDGDKTVPYWHAVVKSKLPRVRISHFSVQEYLFSERIKQGPATAFALQESIQHAQISKICVIYLSNDKLIRHPFTDELVKEYPLALYAAKYWSDHYKLADEEIIRPLLSDPDFKRFEINFDNTAENNISPLYYAASLGLESIVAEFVNNGHDLNAQEGHHGSALAVASFNGHKKVVQLLLENGADANIKGGHCGSPLAAASFNGHDELVQMLLDSGADADAQLRGNFGFLFLTLREDSGVRLARVIVIKARSALIHPRKIIPYYSTALVAASVNGHEKVVQALLDKGADINAQGGYYGPALAAASLTGQQAVVQMLLDKGADVDARVGAYGSALKVASSNGHKEVVQLLIKHGARPDDNNDGPDDDDDRPSEAFTKSAIEWASRRY